MANWSLTFDQPLPWLLLLLLLPLLWWFSLKSLSGLGRVRRVVAVGLRTLCLVLIVFALAGAQMKRTSDRMTVIYLLDQSESIPLAQRQAMVDYVVGAVQTHRDVRRRDRAAVIVFGRDANIEVAPLEASELPIYGRLETVADLRTDATNLAAAIKLAQGIFPEDSARRLVVVTDGNENEGNAQAVARLLAEDGVGVDVVPVRLGDQGEVAVETIVLPNDVRRGEPFEARVVVNHLQPDAASGDTSQAISGKLVLLRRQGQSEETLAEQQVELPPGKRVFSFINEIDVADFYEYEARFVPDDPAADTQPQNNRATAFTQVLAEGHVLLIEDWEHQGEFDHLIERLRGQDIQVTVRPSNQLFTSLGELQRFDCVILANVPRSSGESAEDVTNFSDEQIQMLVRNTKEMGCGLIMLGGERSFGAGAWANTELEKAMPVDFQIRNAKVVPIGALGMVMHASEIAQGNYWQKVIAREALNVLGPQDYCGVIHWTGKEEWLWNHPNGFAQVGPNRKVMMARLGRMTPGDMQDFDPSLRLAAAGFAKLADAAVKHMIVISDGDPTPASNRVLQQFKSLGVKITTVAVGAHGPAGHQELQRIANATGGKYYVVNNPKALPRIYQRETRRVARPLIKETQVEPILTLRQHEVLEGIDGPPPPINGFVLTSVKENPLVQVLMVSPDPPETENATLVACWQYDLGRTAVVTTDAGFRWANLWTGWPDYDKLFVQLVRWAMRPTGDQGNYTVATEVENGQVRVVVTALDAQDQLLNFLDMGASAIDPDMQSHQLSLEQVAPGRYVGQFEAQTPGSYFLTINPGDGRTLLRTGVNVPYSSEYRDRELNQALLENLASLVPSGGEPGAITPPITPMTVDELVRTHNSFRRDLALSVSVQDIWPLLALVCGCIFFADVFVRRVAVGWEWLAPAYQRVRRILGRDVEQPDYEERLERLRGRKAAIDEALDRQRAAARFEPVGDEPAEDVVAQTLAHPATGAPKAPARGEALGPAAQEQDDYTTRLRKAKEQALKAKKDRQAGSDPPRSGSDA